MSVGALYSSLNSSLAEIRLLEIIFSGVDASLECTLHVIIEPADIEPS
jgi:hypothetical protein